MSSQFGIYNQQINDCYSHCISAIPSTEILHGRPYGGCSILWKKNLVACVSPISTVSKRLCAVTIMMNNVSFLLCNVYMPTGTSGSSMEEYRSVLNEIKSIFLNSNCVYVIIGGDFNTDFSKTGVNVNLLKMFVEAENLKAVVNHEVNQIQFTYESKSNMSKSLIDHFLINDSLLQHVNVYKSLHDFNNFSDHYPVSITFDIPANYSFNVNNVNGKSVCWELAKNCDLANYKEILTNTLDSIKLPWDTLMCNDVNCGNRSHFSEIECLHDVIIKQCIDASNNSIPTKKRGFKKSIQGWSEYVKEAKETALFWHKLWQQNGCPSSGIIADVRRRTRYKYHYAIRYVTKNKKSITANKMAQQILNSELKGFWANVKKVNGVKSNLPCSVDSVVGQDKISDLFASKYEQLYKSVPYNTENLNKLKAKIDSNVNLMYDGELKPVNKITVSNVIKGISALKRDKTDIDSGHCSNHLIYSCHKLHVILSLLFNSMLIHGYAPSVMLKGTVIPIPKNKLKSINDSNNYRGITLSSIIGKLLDNIILINYRMSLDTSEFQFGFKSESSTTQCTFVLEEVLQYYKNNNTDVYVMMLDASKAFDRVEYTKLFSLLVERKLCPVICRLLLYMYTNQRLCVKWGSNISREFSVHNGVKQGGILSPLLFTVYVDVLLLRLKQAGLGCHIGNSFVGSIAYADDIVLLAPTVNALKSMLNICDDFGSEFQVLFNASKYQLLHYSTSKKSIENIVHNNQVIECKPLATHLGHTVGPCAKSNVIQDGIDSFTTALNGIIVSFHDAYTDVKYQLFKAFCMSLYGSVLWDFESNFISKFYVTWRKGIRKLLRLPFLTHCKYLPLICNDIPINIQLYRRFNNFLFKAYNSNNVLVKMCCNLAINGSGSSISNNINVISEYLLCNRKTVWGNPSAFKSIVDDYVDNIYTLDDLLNIGNIKDLLFIRDARCTMFKYQELNDLLEFFSTCN